MRQHAGPGIGLVADHEGIDVVSRRNHYRRNRQAIFAGEIQIALVMGRAAENRTGAIFHQHEICDIDRQLPVRVERIGRL